MLRPLNLKIDASPNLSRRVADALRNAIALGELKPGDRLVERILCEKMGVSKASLREAMRELENEGLVTNLPNRGAIVSILTSKEAKAIFEVRATLEGLICRLFCEKASAADMAACEEAYVAVAVAYKVGVPPEMIAAKSRLYDALMAGADNEVAERMLRSIHIRVSQLRVISLADPTRRVASLSEIETLLEAIRNRDSARAEQVSRAHVEQAEKTALITLK